MQLSFEWSPARQEIAVDGERYAHDGPTKTSIAHDVAHLLAAASGLPWLPRGTLREISLAEFNAVLLEHVAGDVLSGALGLRPNGLAWTLRHAQWFLEVHYKNPLPFAEALGAFVAGVDVAVVTRLSPVFFATRLYELGNKTARARPVAGAFSSDFVPEPDRVSRRAQPMLERQLLAIVKRYSLTGRTIELTASTIARR